MGNNWGSTDNDRWWKGYNDVDVEWHKLKEFCDKHEKTIDQLALTDEELKMGFLDLIEKIDFEIKLKDLPLKILLGSIRNCETLETKKYYNIAANLEHIIIKLSSNTNINWSKISVGE